MLFTRKSDALTSPSGGSTTLIGTGVTVTGDISSTTDIRIDGILVGNVVSSARILVGPGGQIDGDLDCQMADVMGRIKGNIRTREMLSLRGDATVTGDIFAARLQVEPTANFNGRCYMNSNVVEMQQDEQSAERAKIK